MAQKYFDDNFTSIKFAKSTDLFIEYRFDQIGSQQILAGLKIHVCALVRRRLPRPGRKEVGAHVRRAG